MQEMVDDIILDCNCIRYQVFADFRLVLKMTYQLTTHEIYIRTKVQYIYVNEKKNNLRDKRTTMPRQSKLIFFK